MLSAIKVNIWVLGNGPDSSTSGTAASRPLHESHRTPVLTHRKKVEVGFCGSLKTSLWCEHISGAPDSSVSMGRASLGWQRALIVISERQNTHDLSLQPEAGKSGQSQVMSRKVWGGEEVLKLRTEG